MKSKNLFKNYLKYLVENKENLTFSNLKIVAQKINDKAFDHALISIRDTRQHFPDVSKEEFDRFILRLAREGFISLHHHDHPSGVDEKTRNAMVKDDRGNYYIGFALEDETDETDDEQDDFAYLSNAEKVLKTIQSQKAGQFISFQTLQYNLPFIDKKELQDILKSLEERGIIKIGFTIS